MEGDTGYNPAATDRWGGGKQGHSIIYRPSTVISIVCGHKALARVREGAFLDLGARSSGIGIHHFNPGWVEAEMNLCPIEVGYVLDPDVHCNSASYYNLL